MRSQISYLRSSAFICGFLLLVLAGCQPKKQEQKRYDGPTETMAQVVASINANNQRIPTLFASIRTLEASIVDDRGKRHDEVLHGRLLYRAPGEVLLIGGKPLAENIIQLGSNPERYWLVAQKPGPDTAWWGRYKHLGKPCAQPIPIRPDLVLEVLGVATIKEDFTRLPAPVMRYNADADAYMFVWVTQLKFPDGHDTDRFVAMKEIWYDRVTHRPIRVALFDAHGRPTMHAFLSKHKPVEIPGVAEKDRPVVAGEYRLFFPETGSRLRLELGDVALVSSSRIKAPNDRSFAFNPDTTGTSRVVLLDEACGD